MLKFKKSLGQNILVDKNIINKIISSNSIKNQDVLEIGPGTGNLTSFIAEKKPKSIYLVEKDTRFCKILSKKFNIRNKFFINNEDILNLDLNKFLKKEVLVFGNLPYNISTQILSKFISLEIWPPFYKRLIFMFQKEVADRILAKPNTREYGRISILANFRLNIIQNFTVSRRSFFPVPKVDSKIIIFEPKKQINYKIFNIKNLENVTNIFFNSKRKMINKAFSKLFDNNLQISKKLDLNLNSRPSELTFDDYYRLTEFFEKSLNKF